MEQERIKNLKVKESTHKDVMLFKIQSKAKNVDEAINKMLAHLKKELGDGALKNTTDPNLHSNDEVKE